MKIPTIYLYLHQIMIKFSPEGELTRKQVLYIIGRYFRFAPIFKKEVLKDMFRYRLLERKSRDSVRIINREKSEGLDSGIILKIIESGNLRNIK